MDTRDGHEGWTLVIDHATFDPQGALRVAPIGLGFWHVTLTSCATYNGSRSPPYLSRRGALHLKKGSPTPSGAWVAPRKPTAGRLHA
jgi:hypothetical protein